MDEEHGYAAGRVELGTGASWRGILRANARRATALRRAVREARLSFGSTFRRAKTKRLLSDEHFTLDGSLIESLPASRATSVKQPRARPQVWCCRSAFARYSFGVTPDHFLNDLRKTLGSEKPNR